MKACIMTDEQMERMTDQAEAHDDYLVIADDETITISHEVTDEMCMAALWNGAGWIVRYDPKYFQHGPQEVAQ